MSSEKFGVHRHLTADDDSMKSCAQKVFLGKKKVITGHVLPIKNYTDRKGYGTLQINTKVKTMGKRQCGLFIVVTIFAVTLTILVVVWTLSKK